MKRGWWQPEGLINCDQHEHNTSGSRSHVPHKLLRNEIKWWDGIYNPTFTTAKHLSDCACGPQVVKVTVCRSITLKKPVISEMSWRWTTVKMAHEVICARCDNEANSTKQYTYCMRCLVPIYLDLLCLQTRAENGFVYYQRGGLIWFNPMTQTSTVCLLFLAFILWALTKRMAQQQCMWMLTLTHLCVYGTNKSKEKVEYTWHVVPSVCKMSIRVKSAIGDLRPNAGARRKDRRATHRGEHPDIDKWHSCFLFRDDRENRYSVMLIQSFSEMLSVSESMKRHANDVHLAVALMFIQDT